MFALWGFSLACLLSWLLIQRRVLLQSPVWWKPIAFISLGSGGLATLIFWIAFAAIFLIDGDIYEMLAFMDVTGFFSPTRRSVSPGSTTQ